MNVGGVIDPIEKDLDLCCIGGIPGGGGGYSPHLMVGGVWPEKNIEG